MPSTSTSLAHDACCRRRSAEFVPAHAPAHYAPDLAIEPRHLDLAIQLWIDERRAQATATLTLVARQASPAEIALDAVDFDAVAVTSGDDTGPSGEITWRYDGRKLGIRWAKPFDADETRTVAISYTLDHPVAGLFFSRPDTSARFAATDNETERARHWLPSIDHPNARTTLAIHVRADADLALLANGALEGEDDHGDGTRTAHWKLDTPCPSYLVCLAVGDFVRLDDEPLGDIPIAAFAPAPATAEHLKASLGPTRSMLAWMTQRLGRPFPFPKYYQFAVPGIMGAMENISLVSWDAVFIVDAELRTEMGRLVDQINAHEMAHSWFGDAVVCRDFAHVWLKESWATYMETCWLADNDGPDAQRWNLYLNAEAYFSEADDKYKRPIVTRSFETSWQMYDRHLYPGGAARLHTLRNILGDDVFWPAISTYLERFEFGVVETDDFRRHLEAASGRSLARFFDQWLRSPGYPSLKVSFDHEPAKDGGAGVGTFTISQTQVDAEAGVGTFDFTIDVGWVVDGVLYTQPVTLSRAEHQVRVTMPPPDQVRVDPHGKVLHKLEFDPGADRCRRQLRDATDIVGRIQAGQVLAKTGKRANVQAVVDAYRAERFFGVRVELAKALSRSCSELAMTSLAELVAEERDPEALAPLMQAAGEARHPAIAQAIEARLDDGLPPRATQAAFEALGGRGEQAPFQRLVAGSRLEGLHGFAAMGALKGLGRTRRREALEPLLANTAPERPDRVRGTAAQALGQLGQVLERVDKERIRDHLVGLLREDSPFVHEGAAVGLVTLGEAGSADAIEAYAQRLSHQEGVIARGHAKRLRAQGKRDAQPWVEELEELRSTVRQLRGDVERLATERET